MLIVAQHLFRRPWITRRSDLIAAALECTGTDIAHIRLIVDDEDPLSGAWASK